MVRFEDECVGCPPNMGCLGSACPNRNVPHYYCDVCEDELDPDDMYSDGEVEHMCLECLKEKYKILP